MYEHVPNSNGRWTYKSDMVLGAPGDKYDERTCGHIGYAGDKKVYVDFSYPNVTLITGKKGQGKTVTLKNYIEQLAEKGFPAIVIDWKGELWSSKYPHMEDEWKLKKFDLKPRGLYDKCKVFVTERIAMAENKNNFDETFYIKTQDLTPYLFSKMIGVKDNRAMIRDFARIRSVLMGETEEFDINDLMDAVRWDDVIKENVKTALISYLYQLHGVKLFKKDGFTIFDFVKENQISIIDMSDLNMSQATLVFEYFFDKLYKHLKMSKRVPNKKNKLPPFYLIIDEAQNIANSKSLTTIFKEGRSIFMPVVLATQDPDAIAKDKTGQLDIVITHKLNKKKEIDSFCDMAPGEISKEIRSSIMNKLRPGLVFVKDDYHNFPIQVQILPSRSAHAGKTPRYIPGKPTFTNESIAHTHLVKERISLERQLNAYKRKIQTLQNEKAELENPTQQKNTLNHPPKLQNKVKGSDNTELVSYIN